MVEGIQLVVRAGARTIDTGVGNAVCNQNVSRGERAYRDGGRANQSVPMKKFRPVVENFSQSKGATACGRKLQGIAMGRARAIDAGVGNGAFNETISEAMAAPRVAEILFQIEGARNGGHQNESYRHSDVGL